MPSTNLCDFEARPATENAFKHEGELDDIYFVGSGQTPIMREVLSCGSVVPWGLRYLIFVPISNEKNASADPRGGE